ncbi:MAG: acetolactate synthase [Paracoccaceae bacterium]|nr:MAG: acetolactate synthase [Paracoccaceae bacterium]
MTQADGTIPRNGAQSLLLGMKAAGIDWLFGNAGTDFPPIIEALCQLDPDAVPRPVTCPHESAAVGMAHGYWLATGRPQAVMVHVNVGLANAAMGVINAASDNVPMLVMSGRTPITEAGRPGCRVTPIHYGQEMYDQSDLVAEPVKFHYEMRFPEQGAALADRALAIAASAPAGPAYLSLPREVLMAEIPEALAAPVSARPPASPAHPDPVAIGRLAAWLQAAETPLILVQRGDPAGRLGRALADFAARHAVAVAEPFPTRNVMADDHPCFLGQDVKGALKGADLVVVLDTPIPWVGATMAPAPGARVVHIAPDPHFARLPVRGFRTDLAIAADPVAALAALDGALPAPHGRAAARGAALAERSAARRAAARALAEAGCAAPMSAEWMSRCIGAVMDDGAVVFSELGVQPGVMGLKGANRFFSAPHSGGLGWALPAALGAQLADRDRLVIACVGDGSYIFANPVACHQIAEALALPVLTIIKNNRMWNAVRRSVIGSYPDGAAARANAMPLTSLEPAPDFCAIAAASRAWTARVDSGAALPGVLAEAVRVVREERRQALLDVSVALSDVH